MLLLKGQSDCNSFCRMPGRNKIVKKEYDKNDEYGESDSKEDVDQKGDIPVP